MFARPGTLVVRSQERALMDVLELLQTYRSALLASKPRELEVDDPLEVITVYYRMHAHVAENLCKLLPILVRPESWQSESRPDGPGRILRAESRPELGMVAGELKPGMEVPSTDALFAARAVLIVTHTREVHEEIEEVIRRVEFGDPAGQDGMGMGGGGMGGMGGFGGGFFAAPTR